ncbi:MAG TPA: molybdopterin-dependent oxidoreductase [Candidatus Nanoarchaeia archaeon]|nr:molybdopterin-dependent oxidoreductase [Candidatus Nanoarchaeia archaeon]
MDFDPRKVSAKEKLLELFRRKGKSEPHPGRVPPGQHLTQGFPVLDLGIQPEIDLDTWKLKITGLVKKPEEYSLNELKKLGAQEYTKDFHCVTMWSKLDVHWTGIPFKKILDRVQPLPEWKHLIQYGAEDYSTNVPREDVERDDIFLAFELDGKPIPKEHGVIRLIIPHLYGWKASKFLIALEFSDKDKPGFWEVRGYHNHGDALKEERYG